MQKQRRPQPRERESPVGGMERGARKVHHACIDVRGRISHIVRYSMLFAYFYYICNCPVGTGLNSDEYEK